MVTVYFKPGPSKLKTMNAIKKVLPVSFGDIRDGVELGRIKCVESYRERVVKAIESVGGKLT